MERINVVVSDKAKENLRMYKKLRGFSSLDDTLDDILLVGLKEIATPYIEAFNKLSFDKE